MGRVSARRPNIVFLLSDDHAAHAIGTYGSVVNRTPHIDAVASAGVRLDNLFATNSLCAPSRASILTGTYSHVNGVTTLDTFIDASQPTFVTALREAGYRTAFVGKWHMGQGSTDGVDHDPQGFDRWDALIDQGEYHDPRFLSPDGLRVEPGYATELITDLAIDWVESLAGRSTRRGACSSGTRRRTAHGSRTPPTRGCMPRAGLSGARRSRCPRRSPTTSPAGPTRPGERRCASPTT